MTGLILFIRRLVVELRTQANGLDAMEEQKIESLRGDVLRGIANAVERAAKDTLLA